MQKFSDALLPHVLKFLHTQNVSIQSFTDYYTIPLSQSLASILLASTTLLRTIHRPHSSLHKLRICTVGFLFGFLLLKDGTDKLSQNVVNKLSDLLRCNPEKRRSQVH